MALRHDPRVRNPPLEQARKYLALVMEKTNLDLTNVARKAGLSAGALSRPYNDKAYPKRISLRTLRKVEAHFKIPLLPGMDPEPASHKQSELEQMIELSDLIPTGRPITPAEKAEFIHRALGMIRRRP